jgi:hypothetical protein
MPRLPTPLRIVPQVSEADTAELPVQLPAPDETPETSRNVPVPRLQRAPMTRQHASTAIVFLCREVRARIRYWRDLDGGMINGLLSAKPPSVMEQAEYARAKTWVPDGHDGLVSERAGVIYHATLGRFGVAAGDAWSAVHARPFRWSVAFTIVYAVTAILLWAAGQRTASISMAVSLPSAVLAGYLAIRASLHFWPTERILRDRAQRSAGNDAGPDDYDPDYE